MKAITHLAAFALAGTTLVSSAFANTLEGWSTDLEKAFEDAKTQKKAVLVEFTGSDWCPPCMMMRKKVFSQKDFVSAASENFILVELDFPNGDPETKKKNDPYAKKYDIDGFPTVILFDPKGKEFNRFYASEYPNTEAFLAHLDKTLVKKDLD